MENTKKTKKGSKLLIAAVVFFTIGALLFCGGMFALDWDFSRLDPSEYTPKSWTGESDMLINYLELRISGCDFTVNATGDDHASVTWFESKSQKVEVSLSQGHLLVKEKSVYVFGPFFTWTNKEKDDVVINIPVNYLEKLQVKHSGGTLKINGIETVDAIDYKISGGSANLNGIKQSDSIYYDISGGEIKFDNIKTNSIIAEQSGGDVYFGSGETLAFKCDGHSGGLLSLNDFKIDRFDIKMSGGDIVGSLVGNESEYAIAVSKSGGRCNVKEKEGLFVSDKWINVKQSGGTIDLKFKPIIIID